VSAPTAVPHGDMRRYGDLKAEEERRQAAGEDVSIVYRESEDALVIVPRQGVAS